MSYSYSSFEIGENTLREIENQEIVASNQRENEISIIEDSPNREITFNSFQQKTLSCRLKLATQKQIEMKKLAKTKSEPPGHSKNFEISSVSKYINTESFDEMDFSAWEKDMEQMYSPAVHKSKSTSQRLEISKLINHENNPVDEKYDIDNVTFMLPQDENAKDFEIATQYIDSELVENRGIASLHNDPVLINDSKKSTAISQNLDSNNQSLILKNSKDLHLLSNWNLPLSIVNEYRRKGVEKMFDWQCECLKNSKILFESSNLVYSAPTSAGKTLVSEILMIKNILERKKKAIFILPFVSVVREKIYFLQDLLSSSGIRVDGYFSGYQPAGGFDSLNLIVCTIEKANSIVNRLLEQNKLDELGMLVIDEIHLISDTSRGYILELLLTKVVFMSQKFNYQIQIVTMSATLPNVDVLCKWLNAEYFTTDYRPIELKEMIKIDKSIYDCDMKLIRDISSKWTGHFMNDSDDVCELAMETVLDNCQLVIFCSSKDACEQLCTNLARGIHKILKEAGNPLKKLLNKQRLDVLLEQGKGLATGLDQILERCIKYGCAFHHAGLTTDERDIIEMAFKEGIIKVLVATSTLSSGVNLPARRVIIRSPMFGNKIMNNLTYKQMIGRAGRKGKDILGESILICNKTNSKQGKELITIPLKPITSCLNVDDYSHFKRALLEIIASNVANTKDELKTFVNQTLYCHENKIDFEFFQSTSDDDLKALVDGKSQKKVNDLNQVNSAENDPIKNSMNFLLEYDFVRLHTDDESGEVRFVPTRLAIACLSSAMPPKDGFMLLAELQKARQNFVLECDLHAIYLVTPFSVAYQLQQIDWTYFVELYDKLPDMMKRVGKLVGISETFLIKAITGRQNSDWHSQQIHKRFYTALALQELVNEVPIATVSEKYKIPRGLLQSLQQSASTFAAILTTFCQSLQWNLLVLILKQFRERLFFGIHPDLIDLMKLPSISSTRVARALYNSGIHSLTILANSTKLEIEDILLNSTDVASGKFFISGKALDMTVQEIAKLLITDAQVFLKNELGLKEVRWDDAGEEVKENSNLEDDFVGRNSELNVDKKFDKKGEKLDKNSDNNRENLVIKNGNSINNRDNVDLEADKENSSLSSNFSSKRKRNNESHPSTSKISLTPKNKKINMNASIEYKKKLRSSLNDKEQEGIADKEIKSMSEDKFHLNKEGSSSLVADNKSKTIKNRRNSIQDKLKLLSKPNVDLERPDIGHDDLNTNLVHDRPNFAQNRSNLVDVTSSDDKSNSNESLFRNSGISVSLMSVSEPDLISNHLSIVDVLIDTQTFLNFAKEISKKSELSISIGVQRAQVQSLTIGGNLLKSSNEPEKNFKFNEFSFIACICVCFCDKNQVYHLDLQNGSKELIEKSKLLVKKILASTEVITNMYDSREQLKVLELAEIQRLNDVNVKIFDPRLCSWILDPDSNLTWQENVGKFASDCKEILELGCKQRTTMSLGLSAKSSIEAKIRTAIECLVINEVKKGQLKVINKTPKLLKVLENLEMPIQKALAKMEQNGFPINIAKLYESIEQSSMLLRHLENYIYKLNGRKFDLTSSKEVAKVVGIHKNKEKKKISTAKNVLTKIDLPIADCIVTYRTLATTISNVQPMTKLVRNERIYGSSFSLTQTGRISMHEPNLQNVTKDFYVEFQDDKNKLVKEFISFRSVFQCQKGKILISADFCQLELRILTHLCRDPKLLDIMKHTREDIFRKIASKWNHIDENKVTDDQRNQTKQLCYGLIYGMGKKALAEKMNVDEDESARIIEEFHRTYPYIRKYTEQIVRKTREVGYIETVTCRRRYLPSIVSEDSAERSKAERQALNSTIQGSASDLVKNAILRMEKNIRKMKYEDHCKLVLHLHDELFYEVTEAYWKELAKILSKSMENCVALNVPLLVKIKIGPNWGELKEVGANL